MIKLYTHGQDYTEGLDSDQEINELKRLREDLEKCFRSAGIREDWLLDHLLSSVAEQVLSDELKPSNGSEDNTGASLEQTVTKLLVDAGYPDVAARFSHIRSLAASLFFSSQHVAWNEERLHDIISKRLPLSDKACRNLVKRVAGQLRELDFRKASDNLINELAEHNLDALARKERQKMHQVSDWLVTPGYWEAFFSNEVARLTRAGVLSIHPVSQLFPVPRLTLRFRKLVDNCLAEPVTELSLLPAVKNVCGRMAEVADILISQTSENHNSHNPQAHLLIEGLDETVAEYLQPGSKKLREDIISEVTDIIRETLNNTSSSELIVLMQ